MRKIPLGTKIIVTTAGLLAMAGIFYAANPRPFVTVNTPQSRLPHPPNHPEANPQPFAVVPAPIGVAASTTDVFATEYCSQNIDTIDCLGNVLKLATIPGSGCSEKYMTIAPAQSANAGFTPRDIFIATGPNIYQLRPPNSPALFVTLYVNLTPQHDIRLIRGGNNAAAVSLVGALIGFVVPLASVIAHSAAIIDLVVWGIIALLVQLGGFFVARLMLPHLPSAIRRGNVADAIFLAGLSLSLGILDAACMAG